MHYDETGQFGTEQLTLTFAITESKSGFSLM